MKKIKIKYHDANMERLQKISQGDWIDLRGESLRLYPSAYL